MRDAHEGRSDSGCVGGVVGCPRSGSRTCSDLLRSIFKVVHLVLTGTGWFTFGFDWRLGFTREAQARAINQDFLELHPNLKTCRKHDFYHQIISILARTDSSSCSPNYHTKTITNTKKDVLTKIVRFSICCQTTVDGNKNNCYIIK